MELKLYVVTTNIKLKCERDALELLKVELCKTYGGLTVINNCDGYWQDNGQLVKDDVQIWVIVSSTLIKGVDAIKIAETLKRICTQKSQLLTADGHPYFV